MKKSLKNMLKQGAKHVRNEEEKKQGQENTQKKRKVMNLADEKIKQLEAEKQEEGEVQDWKELLIQQGEQIAQLATSVKLLATSQTQIIELLQKPEEQTSIEDQLQKVLSKFLLDLQIALKNT